LAVSATRLRRAIAVGTGWSTGRFRLVLDEVAIERYFGDADGIACAIQRARAFSDKHHLAFATFTLENGAHQVQFGRWRPR
jgi:hypothetical protein